MGTPPVMVWRWEEGAEPGCPLPCWQALSPQVDRTQWVELDTGRCWLICLGLWLSRKVGQGRTTGRKAWLPVEVCGLWEGLQRWQMLGPWKIRVAQDPVNPKEQSSSSDTHVSTLCMATEKLHSLSELPDCWEPWMGYSG